LAVAAFFFPQTANGFILPLYGSGYCDKNGLNLLLTLAPKAFPLLDTIFYRFLLKVYPPFFGGQFSVNSLFHHDSKNETILCLALSIVMLLLMNMAGQLKHTI